MNISLGSLTIDCNGETSGGPSRLKVTQHTVIVACKVFAPELETLGVDPCRVHYLDQGLHKYPDELRKELGSLLSHIERNTQAQSVILIYGYCGGGLEGLMSEKLPISIPLAHDCIPLLLGRNPMDEEENASSTFYLSTGWVEYGRTPLTEFRESSKKLGFEDSLWVAREMTKAYRKVALIDNGTPLKRRHQEYASDMAELLGLDCHRVQGDLKWLTDLVQCSSNKRIVTIQSGVAIRKDMYFQAESRPLVADTFS